MSYAQSFLDDERGGVFVYGPVVILDWRHNTSTAIVAAAELAVEAVTKTMSGAGRRLCYVQRVAANSPIGRATPEVRSAALQHFEKHDGKVMAAAVAIETTGFAASVVRSATAGVLLLRPTAIQTRVFKDTVEGLRWLGTFEAMAGVDIEAAIDAFAARGLAKLATAHPAPVPH